MAIQMTRAEYEAKYGTKPVLNNSALDTTPAPIRMTQEEYNKTYRPQSQKADFKSPAVNKVLPPGFNLPNIEETKQDYQQIGETVAPLVDEFKANQSRITDRVEAGEVSPVKGTFQKLGLGLYDGGNVLFQSALGLAKFATPQSVEDKVAETAQATAQAAGDYTQRKAEQYRTDPRTQQVQAQVDEAADLYKTDETFATDVKSAIGVLDALFSVVGGTKAPKALDSAATTLQQTAKRADDAVKPLVENRQSSRLNKVITSREQELFDIENNYAKTRKANAFSSDEGSASRRRIASTDVLVDAVDEDGVIRTTRPGGAVEQYRKLTVDGVEDVVRKNLDREGLSINIQEVGNTLKRAVAASDLEGADLVAAIKGVERELRGLALRSDNLGQIPLSKVHDAKISTTKNINYLTPPEQQAYRKAIARGYKQVVEQKSNFPVKKVNAELAKYYEDIDRLQRLDGRRVKGGKLGKYFAQVTGNIVGGAAGTAIGGPLGAAVGTIAGGEAASFLKGKGMARTFGRSGQTPAPNQILSEAADTAALPKQRPLNKPDPIVGAPKGVKRTKEVVKVEKEIRDNIKKQKAAIKAGDFTLVAALKEVYDALVEQLKSLVNEIKESAKNPGLGLSTRDVTRFLHKDDLIVMEAYIKSVEDGINLPANIEKMADKLIERFGLDPKNDASATKIANGFKKIIEGQKDFTGTVLPGMTNKPSLLKKGESATAKTTDLLEEARKYDSAESFVTNYAFPESEVGETVYHGTKNSFDEFKTGVKGKRGALFAQFDTESQGIFFTKDKKSASVFGDNVIEAKINLKNPLVDADGDITDGKAFSRALKTLIKTDKQGNDYIEVGLKAVEVGKDDYYFDGELLDSIKNEFIEDGGINWNLLDEPSFVAQMKKDGFDGAFVAENSEDIAGQSIFVISPDQIKTRTQLEDIWKQANRKK